MKIFFSSINGMKLSENHGKKADLSIAELSLEKTSGRFAMPFFFSRPVVMMST